MTSMTVGDLTFDVRRSSARRTMQITVERDGALSIAAPDTCPTTKLEKFAREKRFWVYTKLAAKEVLHRPVSTKQFRSGEGFAYLGRSYRLLVVDEQDVAVRLSGGRFRMARRAVLDGRSHMVEWYTEHATPWLTARAAPWIKRMAVSPAGIAVVDLGFRWGSCTAAGKLQFNWKTILLPPNAIDYVVVHELAHLMEPHHTPSFWRIIERAMPDFAARKQWLAEHGAEVSGY